MDKKVLKQMYADIVSREPIRPVILGIHFEEDACVATDTHVLVVYKQGSKNLAGRTINSEGEDCKGTYPNWQRVIPAEMPGEPLPINLTQLYKALKWHRQQPDSHRGDMIAFDDCVMSVDYLYRVLNVYMVAGELPLCKFYLNEVTRPAKLESPNLTAIVMPVSGGNYEIDGERENEGIAILSYETIINNYAFNSWKKTEKPMELAWIS